jgi:hypothetical protein
MRDLELAARRWSVDVSAPREIAVSADRRAFFTMRTLAEYLAISPRTVRDMLARGVNSGVHRFHRRGRIKVRLEWRPLMMTHSGPSAMARRRPRSWRGCPSRSRDSRATTPDAAE